MAEKFRFFDPVMDENGNYDREYNAQEFVEYFSALVTTGVMKGAGNQLTVTADNASMVTTLDTGIAFILGRYYENDAPLQHIHDTETVGKQRIDRIVIRMDNNAGSRFVKSFVKKGVASTAPIPPALTRDGEIYEISVAQVRIVGGQTFIRTENVVDERGKDDICPWASSKILPSYNENALDTHIKDNVFHIPYAVATGNANAYNVLLNNVDSYVEGLALSVKINAQNTSESTININGLGAKRILKGNGRELSSGNLKVNSIYTLRYNGSAFILQGEGGEGTALQSHVLTGQTFTNDSGTFTGTMTNRSGSTHTGTRRAQGSGYVDISPPAGYYDGASTSRVRLSDANFIPANIKSGVNLFGLSGTAGMKMAAIRVSKSIGTSTPQVITHTYSPGFIIRAYAVVIPFIEFGTYGGAPGILVDGVNSGTLNIGAVVANSGQIRLGSSSSTTGLNTGTLSVNWTLNANYDGFKSQTVQVEIMCWGE